MTASSPSLRAGCGAADMTPKPGPPLQGHAGAGPSHSVFAPLEARAIVFESDGNRIAIVTLDSLGVSAESTEWVHQACGIRPANLLVAGSHTHCAPAMVRVLEELPPKVFVFDPWGVTRPKTSARDRTYVEICARHDGIVVPHKITQQPVRKGELICEVIDPFTAHVLQSVRAPKSGYLHMVLDYEPVVKKGSRLCLIALITKIVNPAVETNHE